MKLSTKFDNQEFDILKSKYHSLPVCKMQDAETNTNAAEALKRIHVITGWSLPNDKSYMKTLIEEFVLFLKDRFWMLNFWEIVQAFRKFGIGEKDWGKNMNLELMAGVLGRYCAERERLSLLEEKMSINNTTPLLLPGPKLTDDDVITYNMETYLYLKDVRIIERRCYDILTASGKINLTDQDKDRIRGLAKTMATTEKLTDPSINIQKLTNDYAKKIAASEYFNNQSEAQKKSID